MKALNVILLGFLFIAGVGCSLGDNPAPTSGEQEQQKIPDQESWNAILTTTKMGTITAEIHFGHMAKFNDTDEYLFDGNVKVFFYDKNGKLKSRVFSERGRLNEKEKLMEAIGNVVAHSDSASMTLYTEKLAWDEKQNKIISNEFVTITTEYDTLYGYGFESDANLNHWRIREPRGHSSRDIDLDVEKKFKKKDNTEKNP